MNYAVLDLETTGHSSRDEIIQIGLVLLDESMQLVQTFSRFVKPSKPIPAFITQLTGIDDELVADAAEIEDVLLELLPLLNDAVLVGHNVAFDAGFLNMALDRAGYLSFDGRRLDTLELLRILFPTLTSYQLGAVSEAFGIVHEHHHRADSDAMATALLFAECYGKLEQLPLLTLQRLAQLFAESTNDLSWFLTMMAYNKEVQALPEQYEHHFFRQFAMKVGDWTELYPPRYQYEPFDISETKFEDFLEQLKHNIRAINPSHEEREAQNEMIAEVYAALKDENHLFIEAGTGTGKSLGYLIPSLFYGVQADKKIVVSTHTINLQEQLRQRDLPLLQAVMPFPFKAAIFKGRRNYLCLRKFDHKVSLQDFASPAEDRVTAAQMVVWLSETDHGDQEELNFTSRGADFWSSVASDTDSCLNRACPWFKRCYYHRAKHEATLADVIITNHSMLFTDIRAERRLLPPYEQLIVDEAHHLEEVAGKHLGVQVSYYSLHIPMTRLSRDARHGQLNQLSTMLANENPDYATGWREVIADIIPMFADLRDDWERLFEQLYLLAASGPTDQNGEQNQFTFRLRPEKLPTVWSEIGIIEESLYINLGLVYRKLEQLFAAIKDQTDEPALVSFLTDLGGTVKDLGRVREELRQCIHIQASGLVYWLEGNVNYKAKSLHFYAVPVDVSDQMRMAFFESKSSVICTSATLSIQKSFQYVIEQLGADGLEQLDRLKTVQLTSPFQYREQALVIVPHDFPSLKGYQSEVAFVSMLVQSLAATAIETNGKMLVLFTSNRMLKTVHEQLKPLLEASNIQLLGQGIDGSNRSKLTRRFQQHAASVLLGTSSFWEGVDIPGDALTVLAIVRLPFQPPNHPLVEAKCELLQAKKLNPFMKLSVPQAVIRFKQGFGRLVRTRQDKGVVLVYDTRVIETQYGKHFLYSLPGPKIERMNTSYVVQRIREWLTE